MSWNVDRRRFLRSAAGPLLPLPLLNLMTSQTRAGEQKPPIRFVTLFKPNGVHPPSWNISGGQEFDFRMSPLMQPFAEHKQDLLILDNMGDFGFSSHANSTRRFLSGHHKNTKSASVDQLIAQKIAGDTAHKSLELTTEGLFPNQIGCSYISYGQNGEPLPRESDPQLVFDRVFRNPLANPAERKSMASLLDRVQEDARSLNRQAGSQDRQTLDQYMTVLRETEKRLATMNEKPAPKLDFSKLQRPLAPVNLNEQVEAMIDVMCLALWTDSTRCITYMLGNSNSRMIFDFLGIQEQHHYLSHFFRNFSRHNLDALLKISLWHMEKFDYLLKRMKSFQDGNGTLLENSIVLFGSGMGHSDNHTATRIPIVLAGQGAGRIKTGRYIRYAKNQELGRLHLSLLKRFGVQTDSFAGSSDLLPGLQDSSYEHYFERPFESWVKYEDGNITAQGRLRLSDNLDEAKVFFVDIEGETPVRIEVSFRDFHDFNLAYHCGTAIQIQGAGKRQGEQLLMTKVLKLDSLFGHKPGTQNG
ncbi:MAG: DUF1552 domain-containing protein [Planctomycetota bacterium]|nr:DUF1552 domain-containing protein [Planctomycetota bacterium]